MKIYKNNQRIAVWLLVSLIIVLAGCEYETPEALWDPSKDLGIQPEITGIVPADSAAGGVTEIVLQGLNFSPIAENNLVYMYDVANEYAVSFGFIISTSSTEIVLSRPNMSSNQLLIKVSVEGAYQLAEISPYKIPIVVEDYGIFDMRDYSSEPRVYCIASDADENVYAATYANSTRLIYKFNSAGELSEFASTSFRTSYDMQIGPGGDVYIQRGKKYFDVFPADGSGDYKYGDGMPENARFFDFDENHNIYCGYKDGIFLVNTDESNQALGDYNPSFEIRAIKVFNNEYLYVAAEYSGTDTNLAEMGVWRSAINAVDNLGDPGQVFDMADAWEAYSGAEITSIALSGDGDLYVSVVVDDEDPILVVKEDGSIKPYYMGGIIPPHAFDLTWSTGEVMYLNPGEDAASQNILAIKMGEVGAPYFGRD